MRTRVPRAEPILLRLQVNPASLLATARFYDLADRQFLSHLGRSLWASRLFYHCKVLPFDPSQRAKHHAKHGREFSAPSVTDYEVLADQFLASPLRPEMLECIRRISGDRIRYDRLTTEFAVQSSAGITRTYFKPRPCSSIPWGQPHVDCHGFVTNEDYFKDACLG